MDSVVALSLEASEEEAVLNPEVDTISQIKTSTEGVVTDPLIFLLQETLTIMEEQSDLVDVEAFLNCSRMGHMAKDCRAPRQQQQRFCGPQRRGRAGHRVGAVSYRRFGPVPEEDKAQASGYTPHSELHQ